MRCHILRNVAGGANGLIRSWHRSQKPSFYTIHEFVMATSFISLAIWQRRLNPLELYNTEPVLNSCLEAINAVRSKRSINAEKSIRNPLSCLPSVLAGELLSWWELLNLMSVKPRVLEYFGAWMAELFAPGIYIILQILKELEIKISTRSHSSRKPEGEFRLCKSFSQQTRFCQSAKTIQTASSQANYRVL